MMITSGIKAQYTMGTTGMMNIPTAEMQQTGTFMIGGNYLPEELNPFKYNSGNYFVNITFFSFLELNYRCILLKSDYMAKKPKFNQQDRSLSVRLRPLKEGKYWPAIVIGSNDPFKDKGYNYFASVYGVATKSFMIGEHRLAATAGYYYPLSKDKYTLQDGIFGGLSYTPSFCKPLSIMAEYDSDGFNVGAAAKLWKHLSLNVFTREFRGNHCIAVPDEKAQTATVTATQIKNGVVRQLAEYRYTVKALPDPTPYILCTDENGRTVQYRGNVPINKRLVSNMTQLGASISDGPKANYEISSFEMVLIKGSSKAVTSIPNTGNKFSARQMELIRQLEKGDKFYITSIVVTGPGNKKKQIASINVVLI